MRVTSANTIASWPAPLTSTGAASPPLLSPPLFVALLLPAPSTAARSSALPAAHVPAGTEPLPLATCCARRRCSSGSASAAASASLCSRAAGGQRFDAARHIAHIAPEQQRPWSKSHSSSSSRQAGRKYTQQLPHTPAPPQGQLRPLPPRSLDAGGSADPSACTQTASGAPAAQPLQGQTCGRHHAARPLAIQGMSATKRRCWQPNEAAALLHNRPNTSLTMLAVVIPAAAHVDREVGGAVAERGPGWRCMVQQGM